MAEDSVLTQNAITWTAYTYRPLIHERNVRVIKLYGNDMADSILQFQLIEVSLDIPPKYFAISYCWGGQSPSRRVICEGKSLLVTENCEAALQRFRPGNNQSIVLWIDAICIDQSAEDLSERNHQVTIIGDIFATAHQVWI